MATQPDSLIRTRGEKPARAHYTKPPGPVGAHERIKRRYHIGEGYTCHGCNTYFGYTRERRCWVCGKEIPYGERIA